MLKANNRTCSFGTGVSYTLPLLQSLAALDKFTALFASAKAAALTQKFNTGVPHPSILPTNHQHHNSQNNTKHPPNREAAAPVTRLLPSRRCLVPPK